MSAEKQIKFRLEEDCEIFATAKELGVTPTALSRLVVLSAVKEGYLRRLVKQKIVA